MTPEMEAYIRASYANTTQDEMARTLGVSETVVQRHMKLWGLKRDKKSVYADRAAKMIGKRTKYTPAMDAFIREHYLTMPIKAIAEQIGGDWAGIMRRIKYMGLELPQEVIERNRKSSQIKPGDVPHSKGKKQIEWMSQESIEKSRKTRFHKGNRAHNTAAEYSLSLRSEGYIWFRRRMGEWEMLHRFVYRVHHDCILSSDDVIVFRDGDRTNFHPDNLERITHEEMMERNTIHRYPPELKATMKALSKLKRLITKTEHEKQD